MYFSVNTNVIFPNQTDVAYDSRQLPSFGIAAGVPSVKVRVPGAQPQAVEECVLLTWHCCCCCCSSWHCQRCFYSAQKVVSRDLLGQLLVGQWILERTCFRREA